MPHEFTTTRRVEFADTDMAGIAHFSCFFRWMEETEHAFLRSLGVTVHGEVDGRRIGFARVHASADYSQPVRFEDLLAVRLEVESVRSKGIAYSFEFRHASDPSSAPLATGRLEVVCVVNDPTAGRLRAADLPPRIASQLEPRP